MHRIIVSFGFFSDSVNGLIKLVNGRGLYRALDEYLYDQVLEVRISATHIPLGNLLQFYRRAWTRFHRQSKFIRLAFGYLDGNYIKTQQDSGMPAAKVFGLCLLHWKCGLLDEESRIVSSLLTMIEQHQFGDSIDTESLESVLDSISLVSKWEEYCDNNRVLICPERLIQSNDWRTENTQKEVLRYCEMSLAKFAHFNSDEKSRLTDLLYRYIDRIPGSPLPSRTI